MPSLTARGALRKCGATPGGITARGQATSGDYESRRGQGLGYSWRVTFIILPTPPAAV